MEYKTSKKILASLTAAALISAAGSAAAPYISAEDTFESGETDGYYHELWNKDGTGNVSLNIEGASGAFSCSWDGIENCVFIRGKRLGSVKTFEQINNLTLNYDVEYDPVNDSNISVYGWTTQPVTEYIVYEAYSGTKPTGDLVLREQTEISGIKYDIYKSERINMPTIAGTTSYTQCISVRSDMPDCNGKKTNIRGSVKMQDHARAWEKAGLKTGLVFDINLKIEGNNSSGKVKVNEDEIYIGYGQSNTPTVTPPETQKIVYGDLDGNDLVDLSDLTTLSQYLLRDIELTPVQLTAADVSGDGSTDLSDLALIKQYVMKDNVILGK